MNHFGSYSPSLAFVCRRLIRGDGIALGSSVHCEKTVLKFSEKKSEVDGPRLLGVLALYYQSSGALSGNASVTTPPVLLLSAQSKFQMAIMRLLLATAGHKLHRSIDGCGLV
jgi:hypothetical protein